MLQASSPAFAVKRPDSRFAKTAFLQGESAYFGLQKCLFCNAKRPISESNAHKVADKPISEFYLAEVGKEYGYGHVAILLKMTLKGGRK